MDRAKMELKALLLDNVKMAGGCKGAGKDPGKSKV